MMEVRGTQARRWSKWTSSGVMAAAGLALVAAGCGSSSPTNTPATSGSTAGSAAAYTISAASVGSFGTVLVNGQGRTLYLLSSERGGKVTCTSSNGCTAIWPPVVLPGGVSKAVAGSGVNASQLGVAMSPSGDHYVTYNGWPLYEYAGDHAGTANGAGITSFGGTWSPVTTSGNPASGSTGSTSTSGGGGGGGGY